MRNLIYITVFYNKGYLNLLDLLMSSLSVYGDLDENTDILIITDKHWLGEIQKMTEGLSVKYLCMEITNIFQAAFSRLLIFNHPEISNYDKILYIDTDILILNPLKEIFDLEIDSNKIYCVQEGTIYEPYYGGKFYKDRILDETTTAFSSGVIFFRNSPVIKLLFSDILKHMREDTVVNKNSPPGCLDQPYIVYNSVMQNKYDNKLLNKYVSVSPRMKDTQKVKPVIVSSPDPPYHIVEYKMVDCKEPIIKKGAVIYHFMGSLGVPENKFKWMTEFLDGLLE